MRRKNLGLKVAALAVTGTIAVSPMTVRAEEGTANTAVSAPAGAAAGAATTTVAPATSGTTPAVTGAASTSATSTTTATATPAAPAAGATATSSATTTATATPAAPVTVSEPAADPATTAPNNVENVVGDDKQGTDIHFKADSKTEGFFSIHDNYNGVINPEDTKDGKKLKDTARDFKYTALARLKNDDLLMHGDLSIQKEGDTTPFDSTSDKAKDVEKTDTYTLKADLDVSPVHNTINAMNSLVGNFTSNGKDVYVNNLETGLRATFTMENNLDGSFHLPTDLEDAKKHYELSSADENPMIYRINYGNSSFAKDKVTLAMDLDLTKMVPLTNQYTYAGAAYKNLYGKDFATGKANHVENFNHPDSAYGTYYQTSAFGNLRELVNHSAKKIQLIMKGIKLNSANGNRVESESNTETATERITDKTVTTEGTVLGTLVGYMNADTGKQKVLGKAKFVWGAIQNNAGRDKVAGKDNDKVYLTVKFTDKERTVTPIAPVNPVTPSHGGNGGNGGNGGSRTPIVNPSTPSQPGNVLGEDRPTPSNQGEVLGENRLTPATAENTVAVAKKGEVLGENRPVAKTLSTRGKVSTGDYNFAGLWASLFGLSVLSLAGYVVLSKRAEEK